jgi:hypothetical protein
MEASRNTLLVPVDKARSVAEFTGLVSEAGEGRQGARDRPGSDPLPPGRPSS